MTRTRARRERIERNLMRRESRIHAWRVALFTHLRNAERSMRFHVQLQCFYPVRFPPLPRFRA